MQNPPPTTTLPLGTPPMQHCKHVLREAQEGKQDAILKITTKSGKHHLTSREKLCFPRSDYDVFPEKTEQNGGPKLLSGTKSNEGHVGTLA